jgi:hypothetical protein
MPRGKAEFSTMPAFGTESQLRFSPVINATNQEITDIRDMNPAGSLNPGVIDLGNVSDVHVAKALGYDNDMVFKELDDSMTVEKTMFAKPQVKQGLMGKQAMAQGLRPKPVSPKLTVNQPRPPKQTTSPSLVKPSKPMPVRGQSNPSLKELSDTLLVTKGLPLGEAIEPIYAAAHRMGRSALRRNVKGEIKNQVGLSKPTTPPDSDVKKRGSAEFMVAKGFDIELVEKMPAIIGRVGGFVKNVGRRFRRSSTRVPKPMGKISTPSVSPTPKVPSVGSTAVNEAAKVHTPRYAPNQAEINQGRISSSPDVIAAPTTHAQGYIPEASHTNIKVPGSGQKPVPRKTPADQAKTETASAASQSKTQPNEQKKATPEKHHWSTGTKVGLGALGLGGAYGAYRIAKPAEPEYDEYYREATYGGRIATKAPKESEGAFHKTMTYGNTLGLLPAVGIGVAAGDIANRIQDRRIRRGFSKIGNFLKKLKK